MNLRDIIALVLLLTTSLLFSKSNSETNNGKNYLTFNDYRDRTVVIKTEPKRIISLAPNMTEFIFALGAGDKLIGRTDYCNYPPEAQKIPSIGNIYPPSIEKIVELNPDIVLASTHVQTELLNKLTELKINVVVIDSLDSITGLYKNISDVGSIINRNNEAVKLISSIKMRISELTALIAGLEKPTVYYAIDFGEYGDYTAGGDTFISDLIELAGGDNIAKNSKGWSYSIEKIVEKNPSMLICSKFYDKEEKLYEATGYSLLPAVKAGKVYTIDNNLVDIQGPRVVLGLEELIRILHPESL